MLKTDRARSIAAVVALLVLLAVGLAIRLAVLDAKGHGGDAIVIGRWADNLAFYGPPNFYQHDGSIYPALLYAYWPIGVFLDGAAQARAIKGVSIPFDLAVAVVVYIAASHFVGRGRALIAPALYLFNPAVLLAGPVWGQVDAAGTLVLLLALLALAAGRFGWAGTLAMVAGMVKPQFGLVVLPVAAVAILRWRREGSRQPVERALIGAVVGYLVVALPLRLDPVTFVRQIIDSGGYKVASSVNAANLWGLLQGYGTPDGSLLYVGAGLLLIGLAASLLPLRRHRDLWTILAVGLFVCFAFFFLPTRVHERYLFPAMAVLAPMAAASWRVLITYLLLTVGFAASLLYVLVATTQFRFWPWLDDLVTLPIARTWISLTLIATAATVVLLLLRPREPVASAPPA